MPGRSSIGTFVSLNRVIKKKFQNGDMLLAAPIHMVNAFNSLPWEKINEALSSPIPENVGRELLERESIVFTVEGVNIERRKIEYGVPQ